ncbi:uncharacterized protein [Antedon mediterranea]|uniref:uncharacterized protein n=1 Tax=Antedon mediterranea TaxID=105859 RepID=UPI003AF6AE6F
MKVKNINRLLFTTMLCLLSVSGYPSNKIKRNLISNNDYEDTTFFNDWDNGIEQGVKAKEAGENVVTELMTVSRSISTEEVTIASVTNEELEDFSKCETPADMHVRLNREASVHTHSITVNATYAHTGNVYPDIILKEFNTGTEADRSICPYETLHYYNSNLYPDSLPYVRCKCEYGIIKKNGTADFNTNYKCEHGFYSVPVLRAAGCENGFRVYVHDQVRLPVTCYTIDTTNAS